MKIFTTINPNDNFDVQDYAMKSWSSKFKVYSVNTKEEINKIKDLYPYINFIETEDTYDYNGKKLIKLNSILNSIKKNGSKYNAIVNSDIILNANMIFDKKILNDGILIGSRYEIDEDKKPYIFDKGYDLFIFDVKNINIFFNDNYVIGMPWWDFWIPMITLKALMNIYHIKNEVIYHKTHKTNYDDEIWCHFANLFYIDLLRHNGTWKKPDGDITNNPIEYTPQICDVIKKFIESKHINIKVK